ncbi:MAG: hypothetical protein ACTH31_08530, partial [Pseudoclavibacter sp.]
DVLAALALAAAAALVVGIIAGVGTLLRWLARGVPESYATAATAKARSAEIAAERAAVDAEQLDWVS